MAFRETLENVEAVKDFDTLGHLDYVVRYGIHQAAEYSYRKFSDEIDAVLKKLIAEGKGLEMNLAGIKYGLGFPNPHPDVLKRYRELGGEIITIGADAMNLPMLLMNLKRQRKYSGNVALVIMQNFMDANLYFKGLFHKIVFKWI